MAECVYCHQEADTGPYGPDGAQVCHPCVMSNPERRRIAKSAFGAPLDATEAIGPDGPRPFGPQEAAACPNDTNGDGDCGRRGCPHCGGGLRYAQ